VVNPSDECPLAAADEPALDGSDSAILYRRRAVAVDLLAILVALATTIFVRYSLSLEWSWLSPPILGVISVMALIWIAALLSAGCYNRRFLGSGPDEYKKVVAACALACGLVSASAFLLSVDISRAFVLVTFPVGLGLILTGRRLIRVKLHRSRARGQLLTRTLVVGTDAQIERLTRSLESTTANGYSVVAKLGPPSNIPQDRERWILEFEGIIASTRVRSLAIAQSDLVDADLIRRISWTTESSGVDLLVDSGIADSAIPRLSLRAAQDVALLHLDRPHFTGSKRFLKRSLDLLVAGCALALLGPVMVALYAVVRLTSPGPGFYVQTRVGQHGIPFSCLKFRTMNADADLRQSEIWSASPTGHNKAKNDPRITSCGTWMRRWSLDELPQILNVLQGTMSIVGPRPIQPQEACSLAAWQLRRHVTKPGLTGLWQISGRSDTTWEQRMQLDVAYIERWSASLDFIICLKTFKTVLSGQGAY